MNSVKKIRIQSLLASFGSLAIALIASPYIYAQSYSVQSGVDAARGNSQPVTLFGVGGVFTTVTNTLLFIIGALSVVMLIIGGIRYTISGGNSASVTAAKNTILYAIVGLVVAVLAYAIVNFILSVFVPGSSTGGTTT